MSGHELTVKWAGFIILTGLRGEENRIRTELEMRLVELLRTACPVYFGRTSLPERYAFKIAWGAAFKVSKVERSFIKRLHVDYRNRTHWKQWIRIVDNLDEGEPGGEASE